MLSKKKTIKCNKNKFTTTLDVLPGFEFRKMFEVPETHDLWIKLDDLDMDILIIENKLYRIVNKSKFYTAPRIITGG